MRTDDRVAYRALHLAYVLFPLLSGTDKFFHKLVNWDQYVSPLLTRTLGTYSHAFLLMMGVMEICFGIGMIFRPRIFGNLLAIYMFIIVANLISTGAFYDIALRDFCIGLSSFALARLSKPARSQPARSSLDESKTRWSA